MDMTITEQQESKAPQTEEHRQDPACFSDTALLPAIYKMPVYVRDEVLLDY